MRRAAPLATRLLALALALGCGAPAPSAPPRSGAPAPAAAPASRREGIEVERHAGPPSDQGDGVVTLARFDLARYRLVLLSANEGDGQWHTLPEWAARAHLVGGINAALFEPDGSTTGLMVVGGAERTPDDERFGGFLAFNPRAEGAPPVTLIGRDCEGASLSALRAQYGELLGNYRLLDCAGQPIAWVDERRYSSAAFGIDTRGRFVLIHSATPYRMRDLAQWLSRPELGLTQVQYVEGGPKATLYVDEGVAPPLVLTGVRAEESGAGRSSRGARPLPNVLGLVER